jgi:hypothetical protein
MEEKSEAEKAVNLAGVAYWAKVKHMMKNGLRKPADPVIILY